MYCLFSFIYILLKTFTLKFSAKTLYLLFDNVMISYHIFITKFFSFDILIENLYLIILSRPLHYLYDSFMIIFHKFIANYFFLTSCIYIGKFQFKI